MHAILSKQANSGLDEDQDGHNDLDPFGDLVYSLNVCILGFVELFGGFVLHRLLSLWPCRYIIRWLHLFSVRNF